MSVNVQHDESTNVYNLVGEVEGVGIVFASVPGDTVRGRIDAVNAANEAGNGGGSSSAGTTGGESGGGFNPNDYTDNGDGTYTRASDGQVGHFTPAGFTPATSS